MELVFEHNTHGKGRNGGTLINSSNTSHTPKEMADLVHQHINKHGGKFFNVYWKHLKHNLHGSGFLMICGPV